MSLNVLLRRSFFPLVACAVSWIGCAQGSQLEPAGNGAGQLGGGGTSVSGSGGSAGHSGSNDAGTADANDLCMGISCNTPPASVCADSTHLRVYEAPGACSDGKCSYSSHDEFCQGGCVNDVCNGDPCIGMVCDKPSANYCSASDTLTVYDVPGTCTDGTCAYAVHTEFCAFGCVNGACSGDPCSGVACNAPPASYCANATTLRSYSAPGTCSSGTCTYPFSDVNCPGGCVNGVCKNCSTSADCAAGQWCNANNCTACNNDQHCGSSCTDCTANGQVCSGAGACVQCVVDMHCPAGQTCMGGACVMAPVGCTLPADACTNGAQSRKGCGVARVIGRSVAKTSGGFSISADTCLFTDLDNNNTSNCTPDGGYDHVYRIFLRKNEKITVSMSSSFCAGGGSNKIWKIIQAATGCDAPLSTSCTSAAVCTTASSQSYVAPAEGWYAIVADSQSVGDGVNYTLTVKLDATTCQTSGCECP